MATTAAVHEGLEGVAAAATRLSRVDGEAGRLLLAGYPVEDLAPQAAFEETLHLLWHGRLPSAAELAALRASLAQRRRLPEATLVLLREAARRRLAPMDALRLGAGTLSLALADDEAGGAARLAAARSEALTLVAAFPALVGAYFRLLRGQEPLEPRPDRPYAAHLLQQIFGDEPEPERARALETYLNTVCDHGLNASTFTARVIVSTGSDLVSALVGAVGALKGPLHGGAPGPALDMVFEIGSPERAEAWLRERVARGERLMGFGHRVYRVRDPRADVLAAAAERFHAHGGDRALYALARDVERQALRVLRELKPGRRLDTNVEFYTALLLHGLGLPAEFFTPVFAVGRAAGWTAHALEQIDTGRLIRPDSVYVGPEGRRYVPLDTRG